VLAQFFDFLQRSFIGICHIERMKTDARVDRLVAFSERDRLSTRFNVCSGNDKVFDSCVKCSLNNLVDVVFEIGIKEVCV
jgi:hypothetical protein